MKVLSIIFSCFLLSISCFAQNAGRATYVQSLNLINSEEYVGQTLLIFNKEKSSYSQLDLPEEKQIVEDGNTLEVLVGDKEGFPIYIDREKKVIIQKTTYGLQKNKCIYHDTLSAIEWQLYEEQKLINDFLCQKAIGEFGGRIYEVWFTPELPISAGPYKLWGLPGLIVEAESQDQKVSFLLKKIQFMNAGYQISTPTSKEIYQSKEDYLRAVERYDERLLKRAKSLGISISINSVHPESKIEIED